MVSCNAPARAETTVTADLNLARPAPLRPTLGVIKRIAIVHPSEPSLRRRGLEMLGSGVRAGAGLDALTDEDLAIVA